MTKQEILAMKVGEELDRLVVTEVMGEPIPEFTPENVFDLQLTGNPVKSPQGNWVCLCDYDEGDIPRWRPVPYSTYLLDAWQLMKHLIKTFQALHWSIELSDQNGCSVEAYVIARPSIDAIKVPFLAIGGFPGALCKAALIAKSNSI